MVIPEVVFALTNSNEEFHWCTLNFKRILPISRLNFLNLYLVLLDLQYCIIEIFSRTIQHWKNYVWNPNLNDAFGDSRQCGFKRRCIELD